LNVGWEETMACQETMEERLEFKEPNGIWSGKSGGPYRRGLSEILRNNEEVVQGLHLATGLCRELKELTKGDCGSWRKWAATCRKVSHHAAVAWCKGNFFSKIWTQGNCGPQKELSITCREVTHCAKVAHFRGHHCKRYDQDNVI
jgi:hypothetical protein